MKRSFSIAILIFASSGGVARGETWVASRVWAAGTDKSVWVAGSSTSSGKVLPLVQIWNGAAGADAELPALSNEIPPISGNPIAVAADAAGLRILYADLTQCDYFAERAYSPGPRWLDQSSRPPLAWCGDAARPVSYALVATSSLPAPSEATTRDSNDLDDDSILDAPPPTLPIPTTTYCLLVYQGSVWSRIDGPAQLTALDRAWLCARDGRVLLFYEVENAVRCVQYNGESWSDARKLPDAGKLQHAWPGYAESGPVFIAAIGRSDERCELKVLHLDAEGAWQVGETLRENLDFMEVSPRRCGVAIAGGRIVIARAAAAGGVELASVAMDGVEPMRFVPLSMQRPQVAPQGTLQETIALIVGLAVLTFVMWARRQQLALPAAVPQGLQIASVWRRVMATFIDFSPAILIAMPWMMRALPELFQGLAWEEVQLRLARPEVQAKLMPIQYASVVIYGVWCWAWELFTRATPGKYLFGCRVLGIDGSLPSGRQIMLRNLCRMLMVGIGPSGWIITLMMMGMLSRNRQRVGDLLAFTIVVEEAPPPMEDSFLGGPDDGPSI